MIYSSAYETWIYHKSSNDGAFSLPKNLIANAASVFSLTPQTQFTTLHRWSEFGELQQLPINKWEQVEHGSTCGIYHRSWGHCHCHSLPLFSISNWSHSYDSNPSIHDSNPSTSPRPLFESDQQETAWGFGTSDHEITVNGPAEGTSTFYDFITLWKTCLTSFSHNSSLSTHSPLP